MTNSAPSSSCERSGGPGRNRTGIRGFAVRCITTLPPDPGEVGLYRVHRLTRSSPHQVGGGGSVGIRLASCPAHRYKRDCSHHDEREMDRASQAFADARNRMVDSQVRPNKVTDPRILAAMRHLPRERFIPPDLAALAYADADVPLGAGRVLIEPMVIARLLQLAAVAVGERTLVVGAGTGYGAAVLAACGARVTALEESAPLLAIARSILAELAPGVSLVSGPLAAGWPPGAPYDVILIEGAVRDGSASDRRAVAQGNRPAGHGVQQSRDPRAGGFGRGYRGWLAHAADVRLRHAANPEPGAARWLRVLNGRTASRSSRPRNVAILAPSQRRDPRVSHSAAMHPRGAQQSLGVRSPTVANDAVIRRLRPRLQ